jgi:ABC-type branched-subunit amino acid transport system substrate-binding protein
MAKFGTRARIATLAVLALAAASCASDKAVGGAPATGGDGVKTGPGVTATTITVGVVTDLTGPYASLGKSLTQAQQLYFEQANAAGGACGRKYEVIVRDHGYDTQKAVAAYTEIGPKSAAIPQFIGSPMVTALKQRIDTDKLLTIPMAWATSLLGSRAIQVTGTTYDIDMINGVDFLMSAQVAAFKAANVKAVLVSVGPRQAASLVGVALAGGMDVPFVGSNSAYSPQLLGTPAAPALLKDFYVMTAGAPVSAPMPAMQKLVADYQAKYPGQTLDNAVPTGWSAAMIVDEAVKKACAAKDLSHEGILAAHRSQSTFEGGFGTPMDFTFFDKPASRASYILKPDKAAIGGSVVLKEAAVSDLAKDYPVPVG